MTDTERQPAEPGSSDASTASPTDEQSTPPTTTSGRPRTRTRSRGRRGAAGRTEAGSPADADASGSADAASRSDDAPDAADGGTVDTERADAEAASSGDASSGEGSSDDGSSSDDDRGKRRRRRGRRGRGRGRGKGRSDQAADEGDGEPASAATDDDAAAPGTDAVEGTSEPAQGDEADPGESDGAGGASAKKGSGRTGSGAKGGSGTKAASGGKGGSGTRRSGSGTKRAGRDTDEKRSDDANGEPDRDPDDAEVEKAIARGGTRMAAKRSGRRGSASGGGGGRRQQRPGGVPEEVRRAILEGPPRTMLVTSRADRTQIAVMEDRTVVEHYVTRKEDVTYVGNIYMARVQNVLPGMEAAFLDIGKGRNGVLYAGEVLYDELDLEEGEDERIENVLKQGQKVLVQVTKDPMGSKGPRLTMHLSLAGRYMVLAPNSELFGISRKLTDKERDRLRKVVKQVKPEHHGVIVRTAAEGATEEQITADLERLLAKWAKVEEEASDAVALTTVYEEPKLVVKVIRDNFGPEFERCIVDDEELYHQVRGYLDEVAPELLDKVELYGAPTADARARAAGAPSIEEAAADDRTSDAGDADDEAPKEVDLAAANARRESLPPLFDAYDVTDQLRKAMGKKVWLPSGGYLIIEPTEAMKVIDVNTGKFTGGNDTNLEEVVLKTNLEAADEIVRQLRLRDMGGIIIIDFIDMLLKSNQDQVVRRLKRELLRDRTKTRVSEVSRLGLVQMTRKNVSQGLVESFSHSCERCEGRGIVSELE